MMSTVATDNTGTDIERLRRENKHLRRELAEAQHKLKERDEYLRWETELLAVPAKKLSPNEKLIAIRHRHKGVSTHPTRFHLQAEAKAIGASEDTVSKAHNSLHEKGMILKKRETELREDGTPITRVWGATGPNFGQPTAIQVAKPRNHGGERPTGTCKSCGSDDLLKRRSERKVCVCRRCGEVQFDTGEVVRERDVNRKPQGSVHESRSQKSAEKQPKRNLARLRREHDLDGRRPSPGADSPIAESSNGNGRRPRPASTIVRNGNSDENGKQEQPSNGKHTERPKWSPEIVEGPPPDEMRDRRQWAPADGKVPVNPKTGVRARVNDPATLGSYEEAVAAAKRYGLDRIGFVFLADDPYTGIDIDDCLNPETGEIDEDAMQIILACSCPAEVSQSGTGVHIPVRGKVPGPRNRRGRYEMYDHGRFFVMTGKRLACSPPTIEERQSILDILYPKLIEPPEAKGNGSRPSLNGHSRADEEVLQKMFSSKHGAEKRELYDGQWEGRYPSQSEADAALCAHLSYWTDGDPEQIDRLFRRSGLMRPKWERADYRDRTIGRVL